MARELDDILDRHAVAPVRNAIVRVDGPDVSWTGVRGRARDDEPVTADHAFRTASVAKTVTAAVVVRLAELGALDLDDRAIDHADVAEPLGRIPRGTEITVRQALNHTAGLYDYAKDDGFAVTVLSDPARRWTPMELLELSLTLAPPYFTPGDGCHYSDGNYVLAGMVAEAAAGEPLHALERRLVFEPLGMHSTWMEGVEEPRAAVAHTYVEENDVMGLDPSFEWAAGGLMSTVHDLALLARGTAGGGLFDEHGDDMLDFVAFGPGHHEEMKAYGLGVMECELGGARLLGHTGFWGTFMFLLADTTISGTVNQPGGRGVELVADIVGALR